MSLFDESSLVMIPSGYKEDVVYSVKPTDGSGDLTFTRASDGTRVNSQGLVERVPWNLVTYSERFTQYPPWLAQNITRADNVTTAPNGTTTAGKIYPSTTSSNPVIYSTGISVVSGQNYAVSIYAKASGKNWIFIRTVADASPGVWFNLSTGTIGTQTSATGIIENVGNGWYRCTVIGAPTSTSGRCVYLVVDSNGSTTGTASGTDGIYIWGAQLNEGSTTKPYFPTTDRLNVPRLDYSNGCPSLLLEPQRTNTMLNSGELNSWLKIDTSVTSNSTTSPDGTQNADTVTATGSGSLSHLIYQNLAFTSGTAYTLSVFAKANTSDYIQLVLAGNLILNNYANFDLANGTITASAFVTAKIEDYGNGWYRCSISATAGATATNSQIIYLINSGTASRGQSFTANGESVYLWGGQFEAGSYPTSYIPTTSASVTRVADAASKTGISSLIGQTEGTIFIDYTATSINIDGRAITINDYPNTGLNNRIAVVNNGNQIRVYISNGGVLQYDGYFGAWIGHHKIAVAYASNDLKIYIDGIEVGSKNSSFTPPTCSVLSVGTYENNTSNYPIQGNVNQALLFKTRLTNDQLEYLTGTSYSTYAQMATALNYTIQ